MVRRILFSAFSMFVRDASLKARKFNIADAVGVNEVTIYRHRSSKRHLAGLDSRLGKIGVSGSDLSSTALTPASMLLRAICLLTALTVAAFGSSADSSAQVRSAAEGFPVTFSAGAGVSVFQTDWAPNDMIGITAFTDATYRTHYSIEAEGRSIQFKQWENVREDTFAGGPRFVYPIGKFRPFAKGLIGIGSIDFPDPSLPTYKHDTFLMYEVGPGTEYKLTDRLSLRAEWDYQIWGRWPPHGLTPNGATIGVVWHPSIEMNSPRPY